MKKKITVIGGGTGTVSVLNGLKAYPDLDIRVIVSMTDDGGSNQIVRDEFGLLPLSDLRKSIIALARGGNGMLRELFAYRFSKGDGLSGHTLGNLIMMALSDITGSEVKAIAEASKLFNLVGEVIPVTLDDVRLVAEYSDGTRVKGEHYIDEPENMDASLRIMNFSVEPNAKPFNRAIEAINDCDVLVVGPGDLYTSTLANIVVDGVADAIANSKAQMIFVNNLMTKHGQTNGMKASDLANLISQYCKRKPDVVLQNNREIPEDIVEKYKAQNEFVIEDDMDGTSYNVVRADLIGEREIKRASGDTLKRSLVRHDSKKLAGEIVRLIDDLTPTLS